MRCEDVIAMLDEIREDSPSETLRQHLAACSTCARAWNDWRTLRSGFRALAEDAPPPASFGFASRVVRRLDDAVDSSRAAAQVIERVARRFVLATLLLAMSLVLALALPSSGPVRGPGRDEPYLTQTEVNSRAGDSLLGDEFSDSTAANPVYGGNQK